ncbi:methyltransferase domain-containing protein [Sphingomonas sp. MMSM20]|uniref:class I SAM-dependent methyltransferase n=1 Tax=Sphingomonas lycopersici TaxID=2951807 RepID=UPI0022379773|nr:methyltransferase domain-containing protein [Sphingomonas lycopersici]
MTIHRSAADGYAVGAGSYVRGRPGYPPEAARWLRETLALAPGRDVLEIGAGTGKFIPLLRATGAHVLALEPVAAMRARLAQDHRDVTVLDGSAAAIPLADGAVDAVVCAQAFHWFATADALTEMRRVLRPGGVLGLIWNVRDEEVPWVAALTALTDPWEAGTPRYRSGAWRKVFPAPGFVEIGERAVRHAHVGSAAAVIVDRTLSVSFIAALPDAARDEVERQVRALIADTPALAGGGEIAFPYVTRMFAFRRVD